MGLEHLIAAWLTIHREKKREKHRVTEETMARLGGKEPQVLGSEGFS